MKLGTFQSLELKGRLTSNFCKSAAVAGLVLIGGIAGAADAPDFASEVRPILSAKCFKCHGPDDKTREAGARFDIREAALMPAKSGKAPIVPGKAEQSEIIRRIFSDKHDMVMPPPASKIELTTKQKDILKRWVEAGADYKPHWAFVAPKQPKVPAIANLKSPIANPIDAFVLTKLESEGLKPSAPADPHVLARRIYLDLIGLPPTPEEADAFVADAKAGLQNAVAKLADRLLASPHYGERWARRWLDLAMYSDTNGYEKDRQRTIWPYRDWVINALNADLPFDQFSILQIAGDMVPEKELPAGQTPLDAKIATGFFRNTMINEEGGIDPLEFRFAAMTTRMHMTGAAWLGLTLQCAQCHTHKFDPITHHEYYELMAFLNNADEPDLDLPSGDAENAEAKRAERATKLLAALPDKWPTAAASDAKPVKLASVAAASGQKPKLLEDDSALFPQKSPETDSYTISFDSAEATVNALRLEALTDDKLPSKGPGRVSHGNFVLTEITITAAPKDEPGKAVPVKIARATADAEQENFPITEAFDGNPKSGWAVQKKDGTLNTPKTATFHFEKPVGFPGGTRFVVKLDQNYGGQHTIGRVRLAAVTPTETKAVAEKPREVAERKFAEWRAKQRAQRNNWTTLKPASTKSNLPFLEVLSDNSVLASGDITKHDTYELKFTGDFTGVRAIRLEALPDESLPNHGPGLTYYEGPKGDFFMGEISFAVAGATQKIASASQSYAKNNFGDRAVSAMAAIDGDLQTGWSCAGRFGERHEAVFNFAAPLGDAKELTVKMDFGRHYACPLGRFRIAISRDERTPVAVETPDEISSLLAIADDKLTPEQLQQLREHFLITSPELGAEAKGIIGLRKPAKQGTTMVLRERPAKNPRPTPIYHRGEFLQPKETVQPGTLAVLPPLAPGQPRNRLGFARWIVSPENPLTARVVVNREWGAFFGDGLVRTSADFGYQGEVPTHPELLDWLALEFVKQGWSLKKLHRLIVTSTTYQQSSVIPPPLYTRDPQNRLLARGPRVRVDAELIRDSVLRASGQLTTKIGGPSVFPPQPAGVTTEGTYGGFGWNESTGESRYRRALYTFSKRTAPYAMFNTFDGPSGDACVAKREISNSALQSLTSLNDKVFIEASQAIAARLAKQTGSVEDRGRQLFRSALARPPTDEEVALLVKFFESQKTRFAANETEAKALAGEGDNAAERAAWTATARAVLNLDEFVTKE